MKLFHIALLLLVIAIWGFNFVFIKMALEILPPLFLCFTRFFLVSMPAVFFFKPPAIPFKWVLTYGLVMFVFQFALMFSGIKVGVSAGLGSILLQTQVFFSLLFSAILLKEKLTHWQLIGALISFSGIALIGMNLGASVTGPGLILVLSAAATWGIGSVIVKKMGPIHTGSLLTWGSLVAWPPLLGLSLFFERSHLLLLNFHLLPYQVYVAIAFITLGATVFGFGTWNRLLQLYPLSMVAPFTLLVPIFGIFSSALFLGESVEAWKILAGVLVIAGLGFILIGPRLLEKKETLKE